MSARTQSSPKQFLIAARRQSQDLIQRLVFRVERERRAQLIAVIALVIVCTSVFAESVTKARRERQQWSSNVSVVVLTTDIPANGTLTSANTKIISLPRALITTDALTSLSPHTRTRIALTANTPLSKSLVIPTSESITVPDGWRVIALPQDISAPPVTIGDKVDLIVGNSVVATDCILYSTSPYAVAVPLDVATSIAAAARLGELSIAIYP